MPRGLWTRLALAIGVWSAACQADDPAPREPIPPFERCQGLQAQLNVAIAVRGEGFEAAGEPVTPHGINSYPLLQHIGDGELDLVRDVFAQARRLGRRVVRTSAFMDGGANPARLRDADGTIREEGLEALDTLVAEARSASIRLLLVLENNWDDYGGAKAVVDAVAPSEGLPKDAFWSEPRAIRAQQAYLGAIASRMNTVTGLAYARDPVILGWELANEPRCDDPAWCGRDTLVSWALKMRDALDAAGITQPVFWGGSGFLGESGENLELIAASGAVDVLTFHLYPGSGATGVPGLSRDERIDEAIQLGAAEIRERAELASHHSMPLVVEELGWKPPSPDGRDEERARVYEGWLAVAEDLGLATLPWMIGETGREDYDGLLITPDDGATFSLIACE